jgi:hypothetical protein
VSALVTRLRAADSGPVSRVKGLLFFRDKLGGLQLEGNDLREYRDVRDQVAKIGASRARLSPTTAEHHLQDAILEALDVLDDHLDTPFESRLDSALKKLAERLSTPPSAWTVFVPIDGLPTTGLPHTFGRVEFIRAHDARSRLLAGGRRQKEIVDLVKKTFTKGVAVVDVSSGDDSEARAQALEVLHGTLDVLNFYADLLRPPYERCRVGVHGETFTGEVNSGLRNADYMNVEYAGGCGWSSIALPNRNDETAIRLGYWKMSDVLSNESRSDLAQRLLTAFRLAGRATVAAREDQAFLTYMISLESALVRSNGGAGKLGIRCARLLAKSLPRRKKVLRRVKDFYELRSAIVHAGKLGVDTEARSQARYFAKECALRLLLDSPFAVFNNNAQLEDWFDDQVLGGDPE